MRMTGVSLAGAAAGGAGGERLAELLRGCDPSRTGLIGKEQLERGLFELHHRAFLAEEDVRAMAVPFELDDNVDYEA